MKNFNTRAAVVAAVLGLSGVAASAQALTRAEVKAQLASAQADGQITALTGEDSGSSYIAAHRQSSEPRAEVKSELAQARADGTLAVLDRSDSGSFYLSKHQMLNGSRSEVKSELKTAETNGSLDALYGEDSGSFELAARHAPAPRPAVAGR